MTKAIFYEFESPTRWATFTPILSWAVRTLHFFIAFDDVVDTGMRKIAMSVAASTPMSG